MGVVGWSGLISLFFPLIVSILAKRGPTGRDGLASVLDHQVSELFRAK